MSYYRDPTANAAIGSIEKDARAMRKRAQRIRKLYDSGRMSSDEFERVCRPFTGVFLRVLVEVMTETDENETTAH